MSGNESSFFAGFMDDYFAECDEHLVSIRRHLLALESDADRVAIDPAILEDLFRSFHSVKGISGMVELREPEMLAHHMESYLRVLRERDAQLTPDGLDALIDGVDVLERTLAAHKADAEVPASAPVVERLAAVVASARPDADGPSAAAQAPAAGARWRVTFSPSAALVARGVNVDSVRTRLRAAGTIVDASPRVGPDGIAFEFTIAADLDEATLQAWRADDLRVEPVVAEPAAAVGAGPAAPRALQASHVVRVDLARLDDLMRMIGDLVITRARLDDSLRRIESHVPAVEFRAAQENSLTLERQLRDLREGVMRVRLVPVGEIFRRMPFVVRDLARETGKRVRLQLDGQDTEIDKFLIERMLDPVLHLVRNAVSHGFETPAEREQAGKPAEGTLRLSAAGVGDRVVLEIADDGRGVDVERVLRRARDAGLEVPAGPVDAAVVLGLICTPGFSTREETDRASGRGVGMAVVRTAIQELNGTLSLESAPGEGTRFVIELPLTLSITDALLATVGGRTFAVPQSTVREVMELDPAVIRRVEHQELAPFRGGSLPIVRLARLFGLEAETRAALHVFVIGAGADLTGIAVDRITGQREIVVRTMGDALVRVPGVLGATDLGDGRVVLILDLAALARRSRGARTGVMLP